jgi:hypothetical protein
MAEVSAMVPPWLAHWAVICGAVAFLVFVAWGHYRFMAKYTRVCPRCGGTGYIDREDVS